MMRREEKAMKTRELMQFLKSKNVGVLCLCDGSPYAVPINYVFVEKENSLYFHGAKSGKKISIMGRNPTACFIVYEDLGTKEGETACKTGTHYKSVIAEGKTEIVESLSEKKEVLESMLEGITKKSYELAPAAVDATNVIKLHIERVSGKADL